MLKNIHPLLSGELLCVLRAMGHGDELALVDANFPAASTARRVVRLNGANVIEAGEAILSVLPLDSFVEHSVFRREVVGRAQEIPPVQEEFVALVTQSAGKPLSMGALERHTFYRRAATAFAVVATGETRQYGDFILVKGVIGPDGTVV